MHIYKKSLSVAAAVSALLAGTALAEEAPAPAAPPAAMFPQPTGRAALSEGMIMMRRAGAQQALPDLPGTGPWIASYSEAEGAEFTVYAPTDLAAAAAVRKLPIYAFGNGGCSYDGAAQRFHLTDIASYGYVAITPGTINSGPKSPGGAQAAPALPVNGAPPAIDMNRKAQTGAMLSAAVDWLIAENGRQGSPYFNKIDTSRIAIAGGSCGGLIAMSVAVEPRVKSLTLFDSGTFPEAMLKNMPAAMRSSLNFARADLAKIHTPVLYMTGGTEDLAQANAISDFNALKGVPAFWADRPHTGHLGMAFEPNAEGTKIEYHWLEYTLFNDKRAAKMFVGKDCSLCRDLSWKVQQKGL